MKLAQVIGSVVTSIQEERLKGLKLLVVQPVGYDRLPDGAAVVAVDHTQAGDGDWVLVARGKDAGWPIGRKTAVDLGIMAIVDDIDLDATLDHMKEAGHA